MLGRSFRGQHPGEPWDTIVEAGPSPPPDSSVGKPEIPGDFLAQPGAGRHPVPVNSAHGDSAQRGDLLVRAVDRLLVELADAGAAAAGAIGEVGHVQVYENGRMCGCGHRGCFETYASASGLRRTVFELLCSETTATKLRNVNFNDMTAKMVAVAAKEGDEIAIKAFEITGKILGMKLADTVAHTSPEAIFLFGGLTNAGDILFKPTRESFEDNLLKVYKNKIKIVPSGLLETNAAVLGASALAWKELER